MAGTEPGRAPDDALPDEDEEALRWAGDEVTGREPPRLPGVRATPVAGDAAPTPAADGADGVAPARPPGMSALTALGAVLYLGVTVGWIVGIQYTSAGTAAFWPQLLWQFGEFTAIVAAPLWFGVTVVLTARPGVRAGWLALGLGVLLPWPVYPLLAVAA